MKKFSKSYNHVSKHSYKTFQNVYNIFKTFITFWKQLWKNFQRLIRSVSVPFLLKCFLLDMFATARCGKHLTSFSKHFDVGASTFLSRKRQLLIINLDWRNYVRFIYVVAVLAAVGVRKERAARHIRWKFIIITAQHDDELYHIGCNSAQCQLRYTFPLFYAVPVIFLCLAGLFISTGCIWWFSFSAN